MYRHKWSSDAGVIDWELDDAAKAFGAETWPTSGLGVIGVNWSSTKHALTLQAMYDYSRHARFFTAIRILTRDDWEALARFFIKNPAAEALFCSDPVEYLNLHHLAGCTSP